MRSARIIATSAAAALLSRLTDGLEAANFSVEASASSQLPPPSTTAADLLLALDVPLETFNIVCTDAIGFRLAILVVGNPTADAPPPSLPANGAAREAEIRRIALVCAPDMRVNAITAVFDPADGIEAIAGEILAVVMLILQCPAMTGVVIPIDRAPSAAAGRPSTK